MVGLGEVGHVVWRTKKSRARGGDIIITDFLNMSHTDHPLLRPSSPTMTSDVLTHSHNYSPDRKKITALLPLFVMTTVTMSATWDTWDIRGATGDGYTAATRKDTPCLENKKEAQ